MIILAVKCNLTWSVPGKKIAEEQSFNTPPENASEVMYNLKRNTPGVAFTKERLDTN